jgi:L-lactate dehydrogenase complex protein LldG
VGGAVSAREEILERVRSALHDAPAAEPIVRAYGRAGTRDAAARLALLRDRLVDYRADVHETENVGGAIEDVCAAQGVRRLGIPPGLPEEWRPAGVEVVEDHGLSARELDTLDGVVTGCALAIAETGTLVLTGGADEGRRALTLVPDLHVCVVGASQIVECVPEAFAALEQIVRGERRPVTFVSGPSATSDIELSRVEGVHGPRRLVVLLVP